MRQILLTAEQQLGRKIKHARIDAGMSQSQLGAAVFVTQQMISDWELGIYSPRAVMLSAIARTLGQPLGYFEV